MPAVALALPELLALAGLFLALGMVVMGDQFTKALFQVTESGVGWIPWIGKKAANGVAAVRHRVNAMFSAAALRLEGAISQTWHVLAYLIEQTGQAIWEATQVGAKALWLVEVKYPLDVLSALAHKAQKAVTVGGKVTNVAVTKVYRTAGVAKAQLQRIDRRIDALEARVKAAAIAVPGTIALPFPRIGALERRARAQAKRLAKAERKLGALTFAALVAAALAKLGAGWIRCTNVRKAGKRVCGMDPDLLDSMLGATLLLASAISLEQLARELQEPAELVTDAMHKLVREF